MKVHPARLTKDVWPWNTTWNNVQWCCTCIAYVAAAQVRWPPMLIFRQKPTHPWTRRMPQFVGFCPIGSQRLRLTFFLIAWCCAVHFCYLRARGSPYALYPVSLCVAKFQCWSDSRWPLLVLLLLLLLLLLFVCLFGCLFILFCFEAESLNASSFYASLHQAIDGGMFLPLCKHVVSQAPQHFGSSENASHLWWLPFQPVCLLVPFAPVCPW